MTKQEEEKLNQMLERLSQAASLVRRVIHSLEDMERILLVAHVENELASFVDTMAYYLAEVASDLGYYKMRFEELLEKARKAE